LLFLALLAVGYLYIDNRSTLTKQIESLKTEMTQVKKDYKELNEKLIEVLQNDD